MLPPVVISNKPDFFINTMAFEQPVLWLGISGFSPEQNRHLNLLLGHLPSDSPSWHSGPFSEADAWLVCGERSRRLSPNTLKILAGMPSERAMLLNLGEVDRPIAFSLPLNSKDLVPLYTFDPSSSVSLGKVLAQMEGRLRTLRARFVLGGQLIARESELLPGIYHVSHQGVLLAVMDFQNWRIGISPSAEPADFEQARWDKRPLEARDIPAHFLSSSLTELRWIYAQRTKRDVLPARYKTLPLYFRRAPGVPLRWLKDAQLELLRELSAGAATFESLAQRTGWSRSQLARDLASLYFAGSVTTTPEKANTAGFKGDDGPTSEDPANNLDWALSRDHGSATEQQGRPLRELDPTVPVRLGRN